MEFDLFNYLLIVILSAICVTWIFFIKLMCDSFRLAPKLDGFENTCKTTPKVSVILAARNEEKFIKNCLDSLVCQDYKNYEIIAVDDSSNDDTGKIISEFAQKYSNVIPISAELKPKDWIGKNWACMQGYKKSTGDLLLFTDADTIHSKNTISLSVSHLISDNLDALSAIPKLLAFDFWTKITLPIILTFLHTRFSALNVNNPAKKTGYFFGSFFIIKKDTYKNVGAHESVKHEIIEDGALGKKVKQAGYKLKMVRGEHLIDAVWARDKGTLWNALKRLMIPLYLQNAKTAIGIFFAVLFLLFVPFPILAVSSVISAESISEKILCIMAAISSLLIYVGTIIEARNMQLTKYALFAPLGGLVLVAGFLSGLICAKKSASIIWRDRKYTMKNYPQDPIKI